MTTTLLMPPARRRAHRNQPTTVVIPTVYLPAAVPVRVLQLPPLAGLRYHAGLGHRVTTAMLARART